MMTAATASAFSEALGAADPEDAYEGLKPVQATETMRTLQAAVERALRGNRSAVRVYVRAYRSLTHDVLQAAHASFPELVHEDGDGFLVVDAKGVPSAAALAMLEEGAIRAPFSAWVNVFGSPAGLVLDTVSRVREALPTVDPLYLPTGASALAHWEVEDTAVLAFIRSVRRELTTDSPDLDTIADTFNLTDTELGRLFGVRRQAVAQWRAEDVPPRRAEKVAAVASIADLLSRKLKADRLPGIARRPADAYGGMSMLDLIAADRHQELLESMRDSFAFSTTA
jgi:nitroreductase